MANGRPSIEHFGILIRCSSSTSAKLLRAVLQCQDATEVKDVINVDSADVNELCRCWTKGQDPPAVSYTLTPLSLAVRFSTNRMVRSLLRLGAEANVKCDMTPLGVAVQRNNKKLVALLLDSGADINLLTHPVMKWKSRDDDKSRERLMQSPLHIACRKGFVAMTSYLLLKHAATDLIDGSGNTPADVARKYGHREIERLIGRAVACRTLMCIRPVLCLDESIQIVTQYEWTSTSQLIMACSQNDTEKASCLIAYGANVNAIDTSRNTPLHYACTNGNQKLVELLLKNNAKADSLNREEKSPMQVALEYGYLAIVFILIEHKCVFPHQLLFATNSNGNTLLHIACKQKRIPVVKQLIKRGAFLRVVNEKGKSPIYYAWQSGSVEMRRIIVDSILQLQQCHFFDWCKQCVEIRLYRMLDKVVSQECRGSLAVSGEDVHKNRCSDCGKLTPDACYDLLSSGVFNWSMLLTNCCSMPCEANCTSLLHVVCNSMQSTEDTEMIKHLIENGADVNAIDCRGNTPLHLACCGGPDHATNFYSRRTIIDTLLDNGASPYVVNADDETPLCCAFSVNDSTLVRWLILQRQIDVDAEVLHGFNGEENTLLLMLAAKDVDDELLWRLVERSARINVPHRRMFDHSNNAGAHCRKQQSLLAVLARRGKWSLIRKLVEVGCCDFTAETFINNLLQLLRSTHNNERSVCSRVQMLRWFFLAGFGQCDEFSKHADIFLRELYLREFQFEGKSEYDSGVSANDEDDGSVNMSLHDWDSTTTKVKTRMTLKWLQRNMEKPTSLSRLCVYRIRHQLSYADPDGKSIFSSIDKLPLPSRLKDSLKLRDIECDAKCFNDQLYHSDRIRPDVSANDEDVSRPYQRFSQYCIDLLRQFHDLLRRLHHDEKKLQDIVLSHFIRRRTGRSTWNRNCAFERTVQHSSLRDMIHDAILLGLLGRRYGDVKKSEESVDASSHFIRRRTGRPTCNRNCVAQKATRIATASHSVRRTRALVQPRRCH